MLKDFLKEKNISVYKLSKETSLPYTTLNELILNKKNPLDCSVKTISTIAKYFKMTTDDLMKIMTQSQNIKLANNWDENKNKKYIFPVIVNNDNYQVSRIHPLKQSIINEIYDIVSNDSRIKKVYLFGSSTTIRCNRSSDVDLAIELNIDDNETKNQISETIQNITNYNCDVLWLNNINKETTIFKNIEKGIVLYEQATSKSKN